MKNKINEIKLSYRENAKVNSSVKVTSTRQAAKIFYDQWDKDTIGLQETFKVMLLNSAHKVKGIVEISSGGIDETVIDFRILFATVLKSLATVLILCHNHPSGDRTGSIADAIVTKRIRICADLFGIELLDHIIITPDGDYSSFTDDI